MADKILFERHGRVGHVVLNRPDKLNALDAECLALIREHVENAGKDDDVRVIVFRGEGRAFCAGADLVMTDSLMKEPGGIERFTDLWHQTYDTIEQCPKPTIAAVHGLALAGGFEMIQVTDLAVVADDARLGDQHARFGLIPGGGATQRLPRLIGERRAKWLLLSGEWMTPEQALDFGLANEVVPVDRLLERVGEMAELLSTRSPLLNATIKRTVRLGLRTDLATALALERPTVVAHMASEDARRGIDAFRNKTTPEFVGR